MVSKTMAPKDAHILILRTCEYVNLHSKRDHADMLMMTNVASLEAGKEEEWILLLQREHNLANTPIVAQLKL